MWSVNVGDAWVVGQLNESCHDWLACSHADRWVSMLLAVLKHGDRATAVTLYHPNINWPATDACSATSEKGSLAETQRRERCHMIA